MPRLDSSTARRTGCLHARRPASMVAAVVGSSMIGGTTRLCGWGDRSGTRASPLLPRPFLKAHALYVARVPPSAPLRPQATGADGWIRRRRCRARCHRLPLSRSVRRRYVRLQTDATFLVCSLPHTVAAPLHAALQVVRLVTAYPEIVDLRLPDPAVLPTAKSWTDGSALSSPDRPFTLSPRPHL